MKIQPKNWSDFQQYKDRKPQWIKLHRDLLNDFSYSSVQIGTKATAPLLWILASEYDDGVIDASLEEIAFRVHIDVKTVDKAINELIDTGFFISLDDSVQECTEVYETVPREEKRREREEREKRQSLVAEIITHLNQVTKKSFKLDSKKTKELINARLNEGFTLENFQHVHMVKYAEWHNDAKMKKFIRPETLYSNKFEGYLQQELSDLHKMRLVQSHTGATSAELMTQSQESYEQDMLDAKENFHVS